MCKKCQVIVLISLAIMLFVTTENCSKQPLGELEQMVKKDQEMRIKNNVSPEEEQRIDGLHRQRVLQMLAEGKIVTAIDKYRAALILQHTPIIFCGDKELSVSEENYLLAHYLALSSFQMGHEKAKRLVACTIDRYLMMTGKPQKYGTQWTRDEKSGKMILHPLDPKTSDKERAKWGVESLAELKKKESNQTN